MKNSWKFFFYNKVSSIFISVCRGFVLDLTFYAKSGPVKKITRSREIFVSHHLRAVPSSCGRSTLAWLCLEKQSPRIISETRSIPEGRISSARRRLEIERREALNGERPLNLRNRPRHAIPRRLETDQ